MRQPVTFSVIVPLYDCRDAGTGALRAALTQTLPRERFEVIAVVDAGVRRARPDALLARCDRVVESHADFDAVESEIALFVAGSHAATGDWLFFTEGHTVLEPDALASLAHHLEREAGCAIVCGRRRNHARTRLGLLVGANNDLHEARAQRHGNFTLGANSPIRRDAFVALGGLDARFARFGETVLFERALAARVRIGAIDAVLCTHHNDLGVRWLLRLLVATGRAKARHYAEAESGGTRPRIRHPVYRWLRAPAAALVATIPLRLAGTMLILAAMALARRWSGFAQAVYRVGVGCTDVSGYCGERASADFARWFHMGIEHRA
ncbi:MAG TPA: glycosyltransferase [Casimicrobiaceae bacterium]|nr:glycosyltransferase [Casimicrobiaceae bacterium]